MRAKTLACRGYRREGRKAVSIITILLIVILALIALYLVRRCLDAAEDPAGKRLRLCPRAF